jgi:hypothetical protein
MENLVMKKKKALEKRKTTATVGGTPEDIYRDVMESKFRNLFQSMFKSLITAESRCEHCGDNKCLQRCHAGRTRPQIGLQAIKDTPAMNGTRSVHTILVNFVSLHANEPLKILCQSCHRKFDAKPVTAKPVTAKPVTAKPVTAKHVTAKHVTAKHVTAKPVIRGKSLPDGWRIETRVRQTGKTAGRKDTYYYSPTGKMFDSYVTAQVYFLAESPLVTA